MKRIDNIHNKTKEIDSVNLPYNNKNVLLNDENLRELFDTNGLKGLKYKTLIYIALLLFTNRIVR